VLLKIAEQAHASGINITRQWAMDKIAIIRSIELLHKRNLIKKDSSFNDPILPPQLVIF
jgi:hypothetical protein